MSTQDRSTAAGAGQFIVVDTAIGPCGIAWRATGIVRVKIGERGPEATGRRLGIAAEPAHPDAAPPFVAALADLLVAYGRGEAVDFNGVPVDLSDRGEFERAVWTITRRLGWGETTTYGDIARELGGNEHARAVGQSLGRNPVPIVVPCHRVLAAGRRIGGFSATGGTTTKQRLLSLERVSLGPEAPLLDLIQSR